MKNKLNAHLNEYTIESKGCVSGITATIRYISHFSGNVRPKHCLIFSNGRSEWAEKYLPLVDCLNLPADCMFVSLDHRGQGASGGQKAWVSHYDDYASDLKHVIEHATNGNIPYSICAHSMGGLIALYSTLKGFVQPESLILLSPLLKLSSLPTNYHVTKSMVKIFQASGLSRRATGGGNHGSHPFKGNKLTNCEKRYEICAHPPYKIPTATFGWVNDTFDATSSIFSETMLRNLSCNLMLIGGSDERVVDAHAFNQWVQKASQVSEREINFHMISNGRHELLMEIDSIRNKVINKIKAWLAYDTDLYDKS